MTTDFAFLATTTAVYVQKIISTGLIVLTLSEETKRTDPIGINTTPMTKNKGSAVEAVRIGCHAFSLCCLKFVSTEETIFRKWQLVRSPRILIKEIRNAHLMAFSFSSSLWLNPPSCHH